MTSGWLPLELQLWSRSQHGLPRADVGPPRLLCTGSIGDSAFQLLPSLSQLLALSVWGSAVSSSLQHLSRLSSLRELSLESCSSISDGHIQAALSALSTLTALSATSLQFTGTSLSALASLRTLTLYDCPNVAAAGLASIAQLQQLRQLSLDAKDGEARRALELAPLSQLTNLEQLSLAEDLIEGPALALLDLPHLTSLEAWRISAQQYEGGRGAAIVSLGLRSTQGVPLGQLLPLPSLERLTIHRAYGDLSAVGKQRELTYLGLGGLKRSGGRGLAAALPELQHLQVLQLGKANGCLKLEDMLALAQLQQLEELCIERGDEIGELYCMLQLCAGLRKVELEGCSSVGLPAMMALVCKRGMQEVKLHDVEGADEHEECLQQVARHLGVQLTVAEFMGGYFWDGDDDFSSAEEGDVSEDGSDEEGGEEEGEEEEGEDSEMDDG